MALTLLSLLSQYPRFGQGQSRDGGVAWPVECTNCSGGGSSVVSIDSGTIDARVTSLPAVVLDGGVNISALPAVVIDGGVNVSALPAVVIDGGVNISALPAVVIDGGVNISSLPAVVIDGGINISALPAVVIDGGVNVSNFPAQWTTLDGGYSVAQGVDPQGQLHAVLTDTTGAQYVAPVRPLPLPLCNPVRRYNCQ